MQKLISHAWPVAAALVVLFGALAWSAVREKSNTFDEMAHLMGGYSFWHTGDYRLHPENGMLPQRWATLPLLALDVRFPDTQSDAWQTSDVWKLGHEFFFELENDLNAMLWYSRGMIVLLGMALGVVVYAWSRRLFGPAGGLISLAAYVLCPSMLAHSALVTSDLAASLMFLVSLGCFWMVLHRVSPTTVLASGLAMGLLFTAKMSAVLILPVALLLVAFRLAAGRPLLIVILLRRHIVAERSRQAAVLAGVLVIHAVLVAAVIWAMFGFRYAAFRDGDPERNQMYRGETIGTLASESGLGPVVRLARDLRLLPEAYLHGFAFTLAHSQGRRAFFNGSYGTEGWWTFFPYAFAVKTPLPTLVLFLLAAAAVAARWFGDTDSRQRSTVAAERGIHRAVYRAAPLWVFLAVYWVASITSHLNIGHRHLLPTYPAMFVLAGAAGYWFDAPRRAMKLLVLVALAALAIESLAIYPHYLAYFNSLAGGPRHAYRHLVDSSLDWGQDLPGLRRWLDERPAARREEPVYLSYFGSADPAFYELDVRNLPGYMDWRERDLLPLEPGIYAISATMLQNIYGLLPGEWNDEAEAAYQAALRDFRALNARLEADPAAFKRLVADPNAADEVQRWKQTYAAFNELRLKRLCTFLRQREPDDSVGYSILIYRLDAADLEQAQFGAILDGSRR